MTDDVPAGPAVGGPAGPSSSAGADLDRLPDEVTIRLPAQSIYVAVLRTAVAGVAARADFTIDDIEDLRIAVDEACALLLASAAPEAVLSCHFTGRANAVLATLSATVVDATLPDESSFGWLVLNALAGTVQADIDGDLMTIMLSRTRAA